MTATQYSFGDVLLASFPFTDHSTTKLRPVIVVSGASFNRSGDIVVLPISSKVKAGDKFGFAIKDTEPFFPQSGLNVSSTVKWTKPMTITTAVISRRLGTLPVEVTRDIVKKLATMLAN